MSVNVTVPVAAEYREAAVDGGLNLVTIVDAGSFIIGYEQSSPSKLVRFTKSNLATQSTFTFPSDGKHIHATGIYYRASTGKAYVTFYNPGRLLVSEVDTTTTPMTSIDVLDRALAGSMAPTWIDGDETNLYVLSRNPGVGGLLSKIVLSGFAETTLNLPTYFLGSAMCVSGGKSYFVGTTNVDGTGLLLLRVNNSTLAIDGNGAFPVSLTSDMALDISQSSTEVWVSFRDRPASVYQFNSSLVVVTVPTTASGDHSGFGYDGAYFWQLFSSGLALRLNPSNAADTRRYTLDAGAGYMTELIAAERHLYVLQSSGIARYQVSVAQSGLAIWARRMISGYRLLPAALATDSLGNVVAGGTFQDGADSHSDFGGGPLPTASSWSGFIAKYSPQNELLYPARTFLGGVTSLCIDSDNNIIVTGNFYISADFGDVVLTTTGFADKDIFVAKYSPAGVLIWVKQFGGTGSDGGTAVTVDANGDVIFGAYFSGNISFGNGTPTLTGAGSLDAAIVKLSGTTGLAIWVAHRGTALYDFVYGIAADSSGDVLVTGQTEYDLASGASKIFIAKYSGENGSNIWLKAISAPASATGNAGYGIVSGPDGTAYVTGGFSGKVNLEGGDLTTRDRGGIFLVAYNSSGIWQWNRAFGGPGDFGRAIDLSGDNLAITGNSSSSALDFKGDGSYIFGGYYFIANLTPDGGAWNDVTSWARRANANGGFGIAFDSIGHLFTTGNAGGSIALTVDFGNGVAISVPSGITDGFVAQYL